LSRSGLRADWFSATRLKRQTGIAGCVEDVQMRLSLALEVQRPAPAGEACIVGDVVVDTFDAVGIFAAYHHESCQPFARQQVAARM